nr:MAG TPA: hypothetical protein [Caudoviricetes sp.]
MIKSIPPALKTKPLLSSASGKNRFCLASTIRSTSAMI